MDILSIIIERLIKNQIIPPDSSKRPPHGTPLHGLFQASHYTRPSQS